MQGVEVSRGPGNARCFLDHLDNLDTLDTLESLP